MEVNFSPDLEYTNRISNMFDILKSNPLLPKTTHNPAKTQTMWTKKLILKGLSHRAVMYAN